MVELESVEKLHPAHQEQGLSYLRRIEKKLGYLLNFSAKPDEGWHHANRLRRVMSPSPRLLENPKKEQSRRCTGAGDPGMKRWPGHSRPPRESG